MYYNIREKKLPHGKWTTVAWDVTGAEATTLIDDFAQMADGPTQWQVYRPRTLFRWKIEVRAVITLDGKLY